MRRTAIRDVLKSDAYRIGQALNRQSSIPGRGIGALGVMAGFPLADPIVGLLITVAILAVLRGAARDIYRRLMDPVDPDMVDAAEATLREVPGVRAVESVQLRWIGHRMRAETQLTVDDTLSVVQAQAIADEAHHQLIHHVPRLDDATVHVNPSNRPGVDHHTATGHQRGAGADGNPLNRSN